MNDQERNALIREKLHAGMSLSDLQKLLAEEHQVRMTYLELRLLADELAVDWQKLDKPKSSEKLTDENTAQENTKEYGLSEKDEDLPLEDELDELEDDAEEDFTEDVSEAGDGDTKVTVDPQPRPGTALSGTVKFASGLQAGWFMDPRGSLGLDLPDDAEQPSQDDIQGFQKELQAVLMRAEAELRQAANDGRTKVTINPVVPAGVRVGGDVDFASGAKGSWYMDMSGRLGLNPSEESSKPTQEDIKLFQVVLMEELKKHGYGG